MARLATFAFLVGLVLSACGGSGQPIEVLDARIGQPTGPNAGLYMTVRSSESDTLLGGSTDAATSVAVHETETSDDGTMTMVHVEGFALEPGEDLVLEPGGRHIMLVDVDRLEVGETVTVNLTFEKAGEVTIEAPVVAPAETMGH